MEKELKDYDEEIKKLHDSTDNMEFYFVKEFDWLKGETLKSLDSLISQFINRVQKNQHVSSDYSSYVECVDEPFPQVE